MAKFRIYPDKANTIASSNDFQHFNSSQNPYTDLWYGGGVFVSNNIYRKHSVSRHLVYFDLSDLAEKISSKEINPNNITSYNLVFKNAVPSDKSLELEYERQILNKKIATSFDLITFPVNMAWDEGRGYDILDQNYLVRQRGDIRITGYSNWLSATSLSSWSEAGVHANPTASTPYYSSQHLSLGNEDLNFNVTNIVRNWLSGGSDNNGFCIAYSNSYESISANTRYISSFYTHKTNSAFKPYLEVNYNQVIKDDRNQVSNNRLCKLFLYTYSGNTPVNYSSAGTVSILDSSNNTVYSGLIPTHYTKGVYYVEVWMSGATKGQKYKDVWNNVTFNSGYDQQNFTQNFEIKDNYFNSNTKEPNAYSTSFYGIHNSAVIESGEVIRIYADTRVNYSTNRPYVDFGLEYRLTMNTNIELIPWTQMHSVFINNIHKNYFDLDTSWLLNNQTFTLSFRINDLGTKVNLNDKINFSIQNKFLPSN